MCHPNKALLKRGTFHYGWRTMCIKASSLCTCVALQSAVVEKQMGVCWCRTQSTGTTFDKKNSDTLKLL